MYSSPRYCGQVCAARRRHLVATLTNHRNRQTECQTKFKLRSQQVGGDASLAGLPPPRNSRSAAHPRVAERRGQWVATVVRFAIWDGA